MNVRRSLLGSVAPVVLGFAALNLEPQEFLVRSESQPGCAPCAGSSAVSVFLCWRRQKCRLKCCWSLSVWGSAGSLTHTPEGSGICFPHISRNKGEFLEPPAPLQPGWASESRNGNSAFSCWFGAFSLHPPPVTGAWGAFVLL